ncbi:phosphoribosylformylglycinamidine synthase subunit PurS, partial [Enterococcus faecalis]|uniref:phosphoribosylformylglycinamidine synthase subunit PurS n=1 Tax=Enterococcus faecalis TaxID=1351 RepID=UPI003D6A1DF0
MLDLKGEAVKKAVHRLGFTEVAEIRVGRYFEMHVQQTEAIEEKIQQICDQLLANVNMEFY